MTEAPAEVKPWFFATSVTEKLLPMPAVGGGLLTEVSFKSGPFICIVVPDAKQLFVSLPSATILVSSAHASRKYVPAAVPEGIVTDTVPLELCPGARMGTAR